MLPTFLLQQSVVCCCRTRWWNSSSFDIFYFFLFSMQLISISTFFWNKTHTQTLWRLVSIFFSLHWIWIFMIALFSLLSLIFPPLMLFFFFASSLPLLREWGVISFCTTTDNFSLFSLSLSAALFPFPFLSTRNEDEKSPRSVGRRRRRKVAATLKDNGLDC